MKKSFTLYCCQCDRQIEARKTTGKEVYPRRNDLHHLSFWRCDSCGNHVGCHRHKQMRDLPLGSIPTPEVRAARSKIHAVIDPLWKSGRISRTELYQAIGKALGREYHTAEVNSKEQAEQVLQIVESLGLNQDS